ncbi:NUDIX hydrolase [Pseudonocardia hydrocarbonoxydans]|uniref:NUDIX hydrolase n=1 Tax=Pseudonocardia hydrocarbonoxydans TaxID=76726 RepID=A0A4Y3WIF2_9PSEU|nr:NUDIX domain-containing protein [Pseudonocardia hydrocarbonoxydans]GEC18707.1 NUDIX hydrolase [Pseudonocardia hydrocarbonoxydans]
MPKTDYLDDPSAPRPNSLVVGVTAFVQDDAGRVLLIKRADNGQWALPGGGQEVGESTPAAAIRETLEETGIDVEITGLVGIYSYPGHVIAYDDGEVRQEFSICFRAQQIGGSATISNESTQVHWVEPSAIDGLTMHPRMRVRIEDGLRGDPQPYLG